MDTPVIGTVMLFRNDKPIPGGWLPCDGRLLTVEDNAVLHSLIGNQFGGDGKKNFRIPDFSDKAPDGYRYIYAQFGIYPERGK